MKHRVAVYGTLKSGLYNHSMLGVGAELLFKDTVRGMCISTGSIPFFHKEGEDSIVVEVYELSTNTFSKISSMELDCGYEMVEVNTEEQGEEVLIYQHPQVPALKDNENFRATTNFKMYE